jgi:hypothetical protein
MTLSFKVKNQNGNFKLAKINGSYKIHIGGEITPNIDNYYYDNTLLMHFNDRTGIFDPYSDNVSLLMYMSGSNGSTTFTDSSLSSLTLTPYGNAQISTSQSKFGGSSASFDGSGDYISIPTGAHTNFGTGDFTIECWFRVNDLNGNCGIFGWQANQSGSDPIVRLGVLSGIVNFAYRGGAYTSAPGLNSQSSINANQWYHVAVCRNNNVMRLYLDGVLQEEHTPSTPATLNAPFSANIGAIPFDGSAQWFFNGYVDDLRVTKGIGRYTSNFTPPSATLPAIIPLFVDSSPYNNSLIVSSVTITSDDSKFGGYAGYFNGSSFLRSPGSDTWQLGTEDFTVESWINPDNLTGRKSIVGTYDSSNGGWALAIKQPAGGTPTYGPEVTFTKTDYGDESDVIIPGVLDIYRGSAQGLYNKALESSYNRSVSPSNTLWNRCSNFYYDGYSGYCQSGDSNNWDNICNYTSRTYGVWYPYATNGNNTPSMVGKEMIMKHVPTNRYWLIKFTSWTPWGNGGGFSYTRKEILSCSVDSSTIQFRNGDATVIEKNTTAVIPTGTWSHVAAVRSSGVLKLFLDGTQVGSDSSFTANITRNNSYGLSVGAYTLSNGSSSDYFNGYLDDLRITKGVARYIDSFTVPSAPFENIGPSASVPSEPLSLTVSEDQGIVLLSWNKPTVPKAIDTRSPISYYGVEYSNNDGSSWTEDSGPFVVESTLNFNNLSDFTDNFTTSQPSWYTYSISNGTLQINAPTLDRSSSYSFIQNKNLLDFEINFLTTYHTYRVPYLNFTNDLGSVYIAYNTNWVGPQAWSSALGSDYPNNVIIGITPVGGSTSWYAHNSPRLDNSSVYNTIKAILNTTAQTITIVINGVSNTYNSSIFNAGFKNFDHNPMAMNFNNSYITYINYIKYTTDDTSATNRRLSNLTSGSPYLFRVRAQNSVGFGNYSSTANISTLNNAPSGVSGIGDDNQAYVSWTAPTSNNSSIRDYAIQYSSNAGASWYTYSRSPSTDTLSSVTGLSNGSDYIFRIAAVNFAGTGIYSSDSSSINVAPRSDNLYNKTRILLHLDSN